MDAEPEGDQETPPTTTKRPLYDTDEEGRSPSFLTGPLCVLLPPFFLSRCVVCMLC
jgi:hypothetical protein